MTGKEFEAAVKAAGFTQKSFAECCGVHRTTISRQYSADTVERYWVLALAGAVSIKAARSVIDLIDNAS